MKSRILAAKISLAIALALAAPSANAQISVIDVANVRQTTVSALQNVATVAKQIQQYQTQLQQYQNMIQNTVGAPVQLWQQATQTIDSLQGQVNQISSFARQAGDVNTYMNQFKNPSYYQTNACTFGNCTAAQRAAALSRGPQVIVGTPGRVMDHLERKSLSLDGLRTLVAQSAALTAQSQYQLDRDAAATEASAAMRKTKPTPIGTYQN